MNSLPIIHYICVAQIFTTSTGGFPENVRVLLEFYGAHAMA